MSNWSNFEDKCHDYLVNNFQTERVRFIPSGKSDANAPDIKVFLDGVNEFNIETKMSKAQSGQFVLHNDEDKQKFVYSEKNKDTENNASLEIKNYMNNNYVQYKNAGSAGADIPLDQSIFFSWIKDHYLKKDVEFFVSTYNKNYIVAPLDNLELYFNVSAKYRMKKSGSSNPSYINKVEVDRLLKKEGVQVESEFLGKELIFHTDLELDGKVLYGEAYNYLIRKKENYYIIRRLSNTQNSNVIFSITAKNNQREEDLNKFIKRIQKK